MIKQLSEHWRYEWYNNRNLFWLESSGTLLQVIPSILMALLTTNAPFLLIYSIWTIGCGILIYSNYIRKNAWMVFLMTFFLCVNMLAIINILFF